MIKGIEREHVLSLLKDTIRVVEAKDVQSLKRLSDIAINEASIFQDEISVSIAVLIYASSKLIEHKCEKEICNFMVKFLKKAVKYLEMKDSARFTNTLKAIFDALDKADNRLKVYVGTVIEKSQIKKGSMMYGHGISLARSADIMGISQWELMKYVGKVDITVLTGSISVHDRLSFTRRMFRL